MEVIEKEDDFPSCDLQKNESRSKNYDVTHRVFISKVPSDVNEQGLVNISEKLIGTVPLQSYKHQDEEANNNCETWAVLEYGSKREAEEFTKRFKQYLGIDAETGNKKNNFIIAKDEDIPLQSQALEDIASFNRRQKPENDAEPEQTLMQFFKYNASGMMITTGGADRYIPGPFVNRVLGFDGNAEDLNRDSPLDRFGDYFCGHYDDYNDVLFGLLRSTRKPATINCNGLDAEEMHISSQVTVIQPKFPLATDHNYRATNKFGELGICWACHRVTAVCCSKCGKYFCSSSCFSKYSSHSSHCCNERLDAMESLWGKNFVNLYNATSQLDGKNAAGEPLYPTWINDSSGGPGEWLPSLAANQSFECTIEQIVLEFGEPIAFLFSPIVPQESISYQKLFETNNLKFVGSVFTSNIPELELWSKVIKFGSVIYLESAEFDEELQLIIATLIHQSRAVCKLKIELWSPSDSESPTSNILPAPADIRSGEEVTITAICCSNMLYVKCTGNAVQSAKLELDLNFAGSCAVPCERIPPVGACVLVRSMSDGRFYRARVKQELPHKEALVHLIDEGVKEIAAVSRIFPLSEQFLKVPTSCWLIKLKNVEEQPLSAKAVFYLQDLVDTRAKLALSVTPSGLAILEELKTGIKVNDRLNLCLSFFLHELSSLECCYGGSESLPDFEPIPPGKLVRLTVLSVIEPYVTCCVTDSPLFNAITRSMVELSQTYVNRASEYCYVPKDSAGTMCLAQREDNLWYRAYFIRRHENSADLLFFDFFINEHSVPYSRIRQLPAEFGSFPILGTPMKLAALFDAEQLQDLSLIYRVKQLLQPGVIVQGVVVNEPKETYLIVPQLLKTLTEEGYASAGSLRTVQKLLDTAPFVLDTKFFSDLISMAEVSENVGDINHNASPADVKRAHQYMMMVLTEVVQEEVIKAAETELQIEREAASHRLLRCFRMDYYWCLENWTCENELKLNPVGDGADQSPVGSVADVPAVVEEPKKLSLLHNIFNSIKI